jgi:hypothetical protein
MTFEHDTTVTPTSAAAPVGAASPTWAAPAAPTPAPIVPANQPPKRRASRWIDIALAGAAVLAIAGVAFAVGRTTAPTPTQATRGFGGNGGFFRGGSFDPNAPGQGGNGGGRGAFGLGGGLAIDGTVTSVSADSLTVKTADGRELTVSLSDSTAYHQASPATSSDVTVGDNVSVRVAGGRGPITASPSGAPQLSASDVTVTH